MLANLTDIEIGVERNLNEGGRWRSEFVYEVIDEHKFFLSAIKYGISFEEVKDSKMYETWWINKDLAIMRKGCDNRNNK